MNRSRDEVLQAVREQMPEQRWAHTEGVMQCAVELANRYGGDPVKADIAALLHDVAKYWPTEKMERIIVEQKLPSELLSHDKSLWHAPVGAFVAEYEFGITDVEILDAIRYHTSGREKMTLLDRIVCLADYIEPGRNFPGVDHIRALAEKNLDEALVAGFDSTIQFLLEKKRRIFPLTVIARNSLLASLERTSSDSKA
ncbi:bis(5'-nucleosyl)-tetraphosphatase (symmetrical) YqeK [Paenibacillus aquistagni]|uniref:bis(5'-nucleosyl)-tetraphosphatase (symmetrical) n=1 Tax=Paenibacillus aquistagni TaxID=1852522 RepID=A0A1X7IAZ7_9BACL|nr:bis(5'-nucleosyl)-tetraphosphatase (symmetrical) YqeK [Paenibacillus aquistagni]NMM51560.1 HD domain-containing protein [Paenibacillus aquistagni]SMG11796.1 putative HD superfamily hydrolase of NAD metabolism [Paenibacillus aquistagni]